MKEGDGMNSEDDLVQGLKNSPEFNRIANALVADRVRTKLDPEAEKQVRADERAKVRKAIAETIEMLVNEGETGAGQSAINATLHLAAKIARGEL